MTASAPPSDCDAALTPSCHLYTLAPSKRIQNELRELGIDPLESTETDVKFLNQIDEMRYEGDKGTLVFIDHINNSFGVGSHVSVLDVGSGFGGPSRLLAHCRPNTIVTALELIPEISQLATSLTARCPDVRDRMQHLSGNMLNVKDLLQNARIPSTFPFHAAQGVLSLCHVPDLKVALSLIHDSLRDDGILCIEDFWASNTLSADHQNLFKDLVGCVRMPPSNVAWCDLLSKVGFANVDFEDATSAWKPWIQERLAIYVANLDRHERVHGREGAQHMMEFYSSMDTLFSSGHLKGCRILARKSSAAMNV